MLYRRFDEQILIFVCMLNMYRCVMVVNLAVPFSVSLSYSLGESHPWLYSPERGWQSDALRVLAVDFFGYLVENKLIEGALEFLQDRCHDFAGWWGGERDWCKSELVGLVVYYINNKKKRPAQCPAPFSELLFSACFLLNNNARELQTVKIVPGNPNPNT